MRLSLVLVLTLGCGCSLETRPFSVGATRAVHSADSDDGRSPVSFSEWREVDWSMRRPDADAAAADGGGGVRVQESPDTGVPSHRLPARGTADELRPSISLHVPAAGSGEGQAGAEAQDGADAGPAALDAGAMDAATPATMQPGAAGSAAGQGGAAGQAGASLAGAGSAGQSAAGQGGAAGQAGGAGQAGSAAVGGKDAAPPEPPAPRGGLLELIEKTLDNVLSPTVGGLLTTVRTLLGVPEAQRTRSDVADVLVRLAQSNACRDPQSCTALCESLEQDCSVCQRDTACLASVQLLCGNQRGFSCDVKP